MLLQPLLKLISIERAVTIRELINFFEKIVYYCDEKICMEDEENNKINIKTEIENIYPSAEEIKF